MTGKEPEGTDEGGKREGEVPVKGVLRPAFRSTIPVMTGYLVLGFGFGLMVQEAGYDALLAVAMSTCIYAGSMQYVAVSLFTGGARLLEMALMALAVNARHLFYGISMLDRYRGAGAMKPYLIFSLTDETYSLVCQDVLPVPQEKRHSYYLMVSLLDQLWWVLGTLLGALAGSVLQISTEGVDFALTALFVTVVVEQWLTAEDHVPALLGAAASLLCLLIFGSADFLIPAMLVIALLLCLYTGRRERETA